MTFQDAVINQINPLAIAAGLQQFYYANFPRPNLAVLNYTWNQSTAITNETTGYFENDLGNPVAIGSPLPATVADTSQKAAWYSLQHPPDIILPLPIVWQLAHLHNQMKNSQYGPVLQQCI
jgi:hypothetical protein